MKLLISEKLKENPYKKSFVRTFTLYKHKPKKPLFEKLKIS